MLSINRLPDTSFTNISSPIHKVVFHFIDDSFCYLD